MVFLEFVGILGFLSLPVFSLLRARLHGNASCTKIAFWVFNILRGRMKVETKKKHISKKKKTHISVFIRAILELELPLKQGAGKPCY